MLLLVQEQSVSITYLKGRSSQRPKPQEASTASGFLDENAGRPEADSMLYRSWETGPEVNRVESSQHFRNLGVPNPRKASILLSPEPQKEIEASQPSGIRGATKLREGSIFWGFKTRKDSGLSAFSDRGSSKSRKVSIFS